MCIRNKYILTILLLCLGIGARAENIVMISSTEGAPNEEVTISIGLQNSDMVSSLQVSIPLDENLSLVEGSGQLGSRCANHSLTVGVKDGVLNVLVYSMGMATITGNSGEIASFKLKLGNQPKTIGLTPSNVIITNSAGTMVSSSTQNGNVTIRSAKAQYSTTEVDFGEVPIQGSYEQKITVTNVGNADLVIDGLVFSDVTVFSSTTSMPLIIGVGESNDLNITYKPVERGSITKTLKVTCNSSSKLNTIQLKAQPFAVNELHVQPVSGISDEEVTIAMTMNNMDAISGFQIEFTMPEQLEYVENSFTLSNRKQDHTAVASLNDNTLRIIAYSPNDKPFTGNDGEIGSFKMKLVGRNGLTLTPSKTVLSATINNQVKNVVSDVYGGEITIKSPTISTESALDFGEVSVTQPCEKLFTIYNFGSSPLTINRIVFNNENLSIKETLPIVIPVSGKSNVTVVYSSVEQKSFAAKMQIYSNDPDQRLREIDVTGSRIAPNYIAINAENVFPQENLSIDITLDTYDEIMGLQFDLVYPGQYYETFDNNYTVEERAEGMTVTTRQIDDKTIRVFGYFLAGSSISAGTGKIMSLLLKPKPDISIPQGTYQISVKDIKFSSEELEDKFAGSDTQCSFTVLDGSPVTIKAKSYSREYGSANPTFEYESIGAELYGVPAITCEATATSPVGTYDILISKGTVSNNAVTYVKGTLTITKAPLTISAGNYSKKQGEANPEFTLSYTGFKNEETSAVLKTQPSVSCDATASSAVGNYDVIVSGATADNYEVTHVNGRLTVSEADAIIITANNLTRVYGEANPELTYSVSGAELSGTPVLSCEATPTSPVGTYDIIISKGTVSNYNDTYVKGTLTITKAPLTISAGNYSKKQGEANPEFTLSYTGFKNNETSAVLKTQPSVSCEATTSSAVGSYDVTVSGATSDNYDITHVNGKLTVSEADAITITANNLTRVYGEANPELTYSVSGGELIGTPVLSCEATATSPVGTYDIIISKGTVSNYNDTYVKGTLTITKAPLTISAGNYSKKQGDANPEFTLSYTGFKNDETSAVLKTQPSVSCEATTSSAVGSYDVIVSGATADNYEITHVNGKLTVSEADAITITANNLTRVYGEANPKLTYSVSGGELSGTPVLSCEATATSPVGTYDIIVSKGTVSNNAVTYVKGTLTITKAPLTISAGHYTKKQGEANPPFTLTYNGFKNNDTEASFTTQPTVSCSATKDSPVGDYDVIVSGAVSGNYNISYVNGSLTIEAAPTPEPTPDPTPEPTPEPSPEPQVTTFDEDVDASATKEVPITFLITTANGSNTPTVSISDDKDASGNVSIPEAVTHNGVEYKVTEIGAGAFQNNTGLTDVSIPASITSIGSNAFAGCTNLKSITVYNTTPINLSVISARALTRTESGDVFEGVNKETCILYVPEGSVDAYKAAPVWKDFKNILAIGSATGIKGITLAEGETFDVFNLYGLKVKSKATSLDGLPRGIYVVKGKKVMK